MPARETSIIILVSANIEWQAVRRIFPDSDVTKSPLGDWFVAEISGKNSRHSVPFYHGGWGKITAAASAQYVIEHFSPSLIVNLGTCGGIQGEIERGTVVLVERTIVYDIYEQMYDADEHIEYYTTEINLDWLKKPYPHDVLRTHMISGDRDLVASEIPTLKNKYGAVAGDWESGSIA